MSEERTLSGAMVLMLCIVSSSVADEAKLAHIFQDNMVLQRDVPVPVWGWADPGTTVDVTFAGQQTQGTSDASGYWRVVLDPLAANDEGKPLAVRIGARAITRQNVVVGEVWLAAGQSNMNHSGPNQATGLYPHHVSPAEADRPSIRITRFGAGASLEPQKDLNPVQRGQSPWTVLPCDEVVESLNIPTGFAIFLRDALDVPIGIIHIAVSGTNQGAWMRRETLESFPGQGEYANYYQQLFAYHDEGLSKKGQDIKSWDDFARAMDAWRANPKGRSPADMTIMNFPTTLYNTRIHPLAPLALRGVIWHQGEAGPGGPYGRRLVAMAQQWREHFGQDFYFIWGTLTRNTKATPPIEPQPTWFYRSATNAAIRKAVEYFGDDGRAAMVELYDVGDQETHFLQKAEASRRFGLAALTLAYGQDHIYSGPLKTDLTIDGGRAIVRFDRVGDGLIYRPSIDGISGVYVKGKDPAYRWATVEVTGADTIEVSHPEVSEITAVGYAVNDNPHETLFNSEGFPASPFKEKMERLPWSGHAGGTRLVALDDSSLTRPEISITHVRRGGYVFQLIGGRGGPQDAQATVRAYIPEEWTAYVVESRDASIETRAEISDDARFVTFTVPVDRAWIIVAEKGKVDEFRRINRY